MLIGNFDGGYHEITEVFRRNWSNARKGLSVHYLKRLKSGLDNGAVTPIFPVLFFDEVRSFALRTGEEVPLTRSESDRMLQEIIMKKPDPIVAKNQKVTAEHYAKLRAERMKALGA